MLSASCILDPATTFFLSLSLYCLTVINSHNKRFIWLSVLTVVGLSLSRGEGLLSAAIFVFGAFVYNRISFKEDYIKLFVKFTVIVTLAFLTMFPWLLFQYNHVGVPVTDSRQLGLVQKIVGHEDYFSKFNKTIHPNDFMVSERPKDNNVVGKKHGSLKVVIRETLKGLNKPFVFVAILFLFMLFRKKEIKLLDKLFFAWLFLNVGLFYFVGFIVERYAAHSTVFLIPFVARGLDQFWEFSDHKKLMRFALLIFMVISVYSSLKKGFRPITRGYLKDQYVQKKQIKKDLALAVSKLKFKKTPALVTTNSEYHNGKEILMLAAEPTIGYMCDSDLLRIDRIPFDINKLDEICMYYGVNLICVDKHTFKHFYPNFKPSECSFLEKVYSAKGKDIEVDVFAYKPLLIK